MLGQLQHRLRPNRAIEMEVQLGLGDRMKVGSFVHRSSAVCYQSPNCRNRSQIELALGYLARFPGVAARGRSSRS